MYAIEFESEIKDGKISIPDNYEILNNKHCKIVLMTDDLVFNESNNKVNNFDKFLENPIIINSFYIPSRDERNER